MNVLLNAAAALALWIGAALISPIACVTEVDASLSDRELVPPDRLPGLDLARS